MPLALAVLLCFASGFLLISLFRSPLVSLSLQLSLAAGYGLGIFSLNFFLSRIAGTRILPVDIAVFAVLLIAQLLTKKQPAPPITRAPEESSPTWMRHTISFTFALALISAVYAAVMRTLAYPHGDGWDAFSIWNLHARFLALSGPQWHDGFTSLIPWSHPDYPLLLPAATAHFWSYLGYDAPSAPSAIGFVFTFATAGVLFAALSILRGRMPAMLAAIALLATPSFIEQGTAQYADVPLSFFILTTIVLLCLHERVSNSSGPLILAGIAAGFAAWTKNEGLLFVAAILAAHLLVFLIPETNIGPRTSLRDLWRFSTMLLLGLVPIVLVIAYFKHSVAAPGELFSDSKTILHKLLTPARYWAVIQWYVKGSLRFGRWLVLPGTALLVGLYLASEKTKPLAQPAVRVSRLALILTLVGYFAIYLITPYDIYWHLRFSLNRLFLQLWPAIIFLSFLALTNERVIPADLPF